MWEEIGGFSDPNDVENQNSDSEDIKNRRAKFDLFTLEEMQALDGTVVSKLLDKLIGTLLLNNCNIIKMEKV